MIEQRKAERVYHTWTHDSTRWDHYRPRADDIVIATPPKCGTTWTQRIVSLLVFQSPEPCPLMMISPWLDAGFVAPIAAITEILEGQAHRRFIKSHLPLDGLPFYDHVKYIHVARDPRDACMSFFNHYTGMTPMALDMIAATAPAELGPLPRDVRDLPTFWRQWFTKGAHPGAEDGFPDLSFVDFEKTYWHARKRANLLLVHYNDLKADRDGEMRRIAEFLDIETPAELWPKLVEAASFEVMKRDGPMLLGPMNGAFEGGSDRFLFKGTNGRWKDELTADDHALADKLAARFSPGLRRWLEGGRLGAGDPRSSAE